MTTGKLTYVLSELARNPKIVLPEATIMARDRAAKVRESMNVVSNGSGLFVVVDEGCIAEDGGIYRDQREPPKVYSCVENAAKEALEVSEFLNVTYTAKGYNNTVSVMRLCELVENSEKPRVSKGKIVRPKMILLPKYFLNEEDISVDGKFAGIVNYVTKGSESYLPVIGENLDETVRKIINYEEMFKREPERCYDIGRALVYFGRIIASVQ